MTDPTPQGSKISVDEARHVLLSVGYTEQESALVQAISQYFDALPGILPAGSPLKRRLQDASSDFLMALSAVVTSRQIQKEIDAITKKESDAQ